MTGHVMGWVHLASEYASYIIVEIFCFIFTLTVLFRLDISIGTEHEITELRRIIYAFLGLLATDCTSMLFATGILALNLFLDATVNAIAFMCVSFGCYYWFMYVSDRLHWSAVFKMPLRLVVTLPLIAACSLDIISIFTGLLFYIDEYGLYWVNEPLIEINVFINYAYLLVPTIGALLMARKASSKSLRHERLSYLFYMVIPFISGMLENVFPMVPILELSIFFIILIFFQGLQSRQVLTDALTGLNNHRWLARYLDDRLKSASAEKPVALFMIDINDFESINTRFGHIEGDSAIKSFATALRLMAVKYNATAVRYDNDLFCLVADIYDRSPEEIESGIEITLQAAQSVMGAQEKPYTLSICIGYAVCDHLESRTGAFIGRAIDALNEDKERFAKMHGGAEPCDLPSSS